MTVRSIGGRGDGVAEWNGRPVYLANTVPGDRARVHLNVERGAATRGEVLELLEPGPDRVVPPCRHFGACGGCALQHLDSDKGLQWKRDKLCTALARRGLPADTVQPILSIAPGTRRRATMAAVGGPNGVTLGFRERGGHGIVDVTACLLLTPRLTALLPALREVLTPILHSRRDLGVGLCDTEEGVDVLLVAAPGPDLAERESLAGFAESADLARLSWREPGATPEPLAIRRPPRVRFAGVPVEPPPGGFLQPTPEGEAALVDLVTDGLPEPVAEIADLYCGSGTFTFPLAARARIHAVEGDGPALAALQTAARQAGLSGTITTESRDLARQPLRAEELARFDAVVFDPPRDGAKAQASEIARSKIPTAIAVSCNPSTFARDARILVDGGFKLVAATPVDQFPWSSHLELVASFRR
jgi:23S rRNA (uracil1939-C5)-methyltransferase